MNNNRVTAAIYIYADVPFQTSEEGWKPETVRAQEYKCRMFCLKKRYSIPLKGFYFDTDASLPIGERPALRKMVEEMAKGIYDVVVIPGSEYVADDGEQALDIIQGISTMGVDVIPADGIYDKKPYRRVVPV